MARPRVNLNRPSLGSISTGASIPFGTTEMPGTPRSLPAAFREPRCLLSSTPFQSSSGECRSGCSRTDIVDFAR